MYQKLLLHLVLALFFFSNLFISAHAQTFIQGKVLSAKDSTGIYGASVYLDGTSYGVSAGENGEFKLPLEKSSFAALIISSMGYETLIIDIQETGLSKNFVIYLQESLEFLDEVYVADDTWSLNIKLAVFRREFLGNTPAALKCKILNEDALRLRYNPGKQTLTVHATEPLIILNNHLGYQITYNLNDFIVQFNPGSSGLHLVQIVYFEGHSFFSEINKTPSRRHLRNREDAFKGSTFTLCVHWQVKKCMKTDTGSL